MARFGATTRANLDMQGFAYLSDEEQAEYAWPLRFTPAVGTALVVVGLVMQSPLLLAVICAIALVGRCSLMVWPSIWPTTTVSGTCSVRRDCRALRLPAASPT